MTEPLTEAWKETVVAEMENIAKSALRTIGLAVRNEFEDTGLQDYDGSSHPRHALLADPANFIKIVTNWHGWHHGPPLVQSARAQSRHARLRASVLS